MKSEIPNNNSEIATCPLCNIELELDELESKNRKFICPQCGKQYDLESLSIDTMQPSLTETSQNIFTEKAITFGTVFGGPLAGGYLLSHNFKTFSKIDESKKTLAFSIGITLLIVPLFFYLPEYVSVKLPEQLFHLLWAGVIYFVVKKYQKESISSHLARSGRKGSGLVVFYVSLLSTFITLAYGIAFAYLMTPDESDYDETHNLISIKNGFSEGILYYDSLHIKIEDAKHVSVLLNQIGYFNDQFETEASYYVESNIYFVGLFVDEKYWSEIQVHNDVKKIIERLSKVFPEKKHNVVLRSVDPDGNNKELKIE